MEGTVRRRSATSRSGSKREILCLVGESGSGKSVIAQAIMGLLPKTLPVSSGKILLEGENLLSGGRSTACASCAARACR